MTHAEVADIRPLAVVLISLLVFIIGYGLGYETGRRE